MGCHFVARFVFFSKIFREQLPTVLPWLIILTATMPTSYLPHLCRLLTVSSFQGESIVRGFPKDFDQREIEMQTYICSARLTLVSEFLRDHNVKSAVIFCNSCHQYQQFQDHLECKLNVLQLNVDVLHINGSLHKTDKFWRICLFCDEGHIQEANFRVLVTTNAAANVGINKSHIALQVRFDWPRDLLTYFQERGRGSRQPGVRSACVLYADLSSYVFLLRQLVRGSEHRAVIDDNQSGQCEGFNSAISPQRAATRQANTSQEDFALRPTAKKRLRDCCIEELLKVLRFFCLDLGCQHKRGEIYLSSGYLDFIPATERCTSCPRGITRIAFWCIGAAWPPFSSG